MDLQFHADFFGIPLGRGPVSFPTVVSTRDWVTFCQSNWTQPSVWHGCTLSQLNEILQSGVWLPGLWQAESRSSPLAVWVADSPSMAIDRASMSRGYGYSGGVPNGWVQRYVFGVLYLIFYRKLRGRWRKSAWPVCVVCHPREDRGVYLAAFQQVQAELDRRQLGTVQQVGLDHFPGLEAKFKEVNPRGHVVLGLGHMLKNLRKNQGAGRRHGTPALAGALTINYAIAYIYESVCMATDVMFHLLWFTTLARLRRVHGCGRWVAYFERWYLRRRQRDPATWGEGWDWRWTALWYFGMARTNIRGRGASQQPPEQGHANLKRGIATVRAGGGMEDVVTQIESSCRAWTGPSIDEERAYTLMAPPGCLSVSPSDPDQWMLFDVLLLTRRDNQLRKRREHDSLRFQ